MTADVSGLWKTASGAEYRFQLEAGYIVAIYWNPSPAQVAAGFSRGDLAFRGTLVGQVLAGTFFQRFVLSTKETCPGIWERPTTLNLELSPDAETLTGVLLEEHLPNLTCVIDDRRLTTLVFRKMGEEGTPKGAAAQFEYKAQTQSSSSGA